MACREEFSSSVKDSVSEGEESQMHNKFQYFIAIEVARSSLPRSELDRNRGIFQHVLQAVFRNTVLSSPMIR